MLSRDTHRKIERLWNQFACNVRTNIHRNLIHCDTYRLSIDDTSTGIHNRGLFNKWDFYEHQLYQQLADSQPMFFIHSRNEIAFQDDHVLFNVNLDSTNICENWWTENSITCDSDKILPVYTAVRRLSKTLLSPHIRTNTSICVSLYMAWYWQYPLLVLGL